MSPGNMRTKSAWGGMFPKPCIIRLKGDPLTKLREACYKRDGGLCVCCGRIVRDNVPDWHPDKYDMAHIKSRGAGGSDTPENTRCLCFIHHIISEHTLGEKG